MQHVLLIESGPRVEGDKAVAALYRLGAQRLDVLTCFETPPSTFDPRLGNLLSVHSPEARRDRKVFIRNLCTTPYTSIVILWVGSGVMRNWALAIGAQSFKRVLLLDRDGELGKLQGSIGRQLIRTLTKPLTPIRKVHVDLNWDVSDSLLQRVGEVALAPFQLGYLILFTAKTHLARLLRIAIRQVPHS